MDINKKEKIISSFPLNYGEAELNIIISKEEYSVFQNGIYSGSMDEKWNVFTLNNVIAFARSWTSNCIFKILTEEYHHSVLLRSFQVNRDSAQYQGGNLEEDAVLLKELLQMFLKSDDLYVDPKLQLKLIRETIEYEDPNDEFAKSISTISVGQLNVINNTLISPPNDEYFRVNGWKELRERLVGKAENEKLLSLYLRHKTDGRAKTLYFNENAETYFGETSIERIGSLDF